MTPEAPAIRDGNLGAHAHACVAAGLCALPAIRDGASKRPAVNSWKPFQARLPEPAEIDAWFAESGVASSMCLVCGKVSGNLEMIDFDLGGAAFGAWQEALDAAAPGLLARLVVESTPSGGRHVVYRCESPVCGNLKLAQRRIDAPDSGPLTIGAKNYDPRQNAAGQWGVVVTMIETRGEGGLFLCAPSPGYEVMQGDLRNPPTVSADERDTLLGCAWALNEVPAQVVGTKKASDSPSSALRPGDDFNARGDARRSLLAHGWTLARAGENEHWTRPGKESGTSATLRDGVLYVFSTNAQPFDAMKGYAPFGVYGLLEHGGNFAAAAAALRADGYGEPGTANGADLSGIVAQAAAPPATIGLTVRELVARHPKMRAPVIHGLLREGETMNIIASPKTGKSWLVLDLSIAVATGRLWLGRYPTEAGDVLIIDNELHPETSADRIPRVAAARGVTMEEIQDRIVVDNVRGRLLDIAALETYFMNLEPGRFKVIVIDAFYRIMPVGQDENDNGTMASIYNRLDRIAKMLGCCIVLIHHSTKGSQSGKSVTDVGAGAGAQSRATDTHLVLRPHAEPNVLVLDAAVRSWKPIEAVCLRQSFPVWNLDGSLDPAHLRPERPQRQPAPKCVGAAPIEVWTAARFVLEFIGDAPQTKAQIMERTEGRAGLSRRRSTELLQIAEADGKLHRWGFGPRKPVQFATQPQPVLGGES